MPTYVDRPCLYGLLTRPRCTRSRWRFVCTDSGDIVGPSQSYTLSSHSGQWWYMLQNQKKHYYCQLVRVLKTTTKHYDHLVNNIIKTLSSAICCKTEKSLSFCYSMYVCMFVCMFVCLCVCMFMILCLYVHMYVCIMCAGIYHYLCTITCVCIAILLVCLLVKRWQWWQKLSALRLTSQNS